MKMKRIMTAAALLLLTTALWAVPALRQWRMVTQPDGTQLSVLLVGDENFHYYKTADDVVLIEKGGTFYYAVQSGDGLEATPYIAHEAADRSGDEQLLTASAFCNHEQARAMARRAPRITAPRRVGEASGVFEGSKKGIIILVSFNNLDFSMDNPVETFSDLVNKPGYNENGAIGSVHDYFYDMSNGRFDLTFDVVGPYKAPRDYSYYGENKGNQIDANVRTLIRWAMRAADEDVDYKNYDWDDDGEVDQVFIVYAGYGEASGAPAETIWPHESQLDAVYNALRLDNMLLKTYACGQELQGTEGTKLAGIGTICHEFSHCLGLPDFYDTAGDERRGNYGMGDYDLMCSGSYNGSSWRPAPYTAYERHFCGWMDYNELTQPCRVAGMLPIENGGDAFIIYNPANRNEYYLMENRNRTCRWDTGLTGAGLLIYHVNYDRNRWADNTVNSFTAGNPCMQVVAADNSYELYPPTNIAADLWPTASGMTTINEFSDTSTPACILYNANTDGTKLLHAKLSKIKLTTRTKAISFTYNDGTESYSSIDDVLFASDEAQRHSQSYNLQGQRVGADYRGVVVRNGKKYIR